MWPNNCPAAVSITYDDGHDSNLDAAIPDLEARGMRGTFFLSPGLWAANRAEDWRLACAGGHEIANHTWDHPCTELRSFTPEQFERAQTGKTEQWLNENIGLNGVAGTRDDYRTYSYICGDLHLGIGADDVARETYLDLMRRTFLACRAAGGGPVAREIVLANPHEIPSQGPTYGYRNADRAIEYCEKAATEGTWLVLVFHKIVDGEPVQDTQTNRQVHQEVLQHLADNPDKFWVAPFREVFRNITA